MIVTTKNTLVFLELLKNVISIHVTDSYGTEHFLGYSSELGDDMLTEIERQARDIWANEVKPKEDLLSKAIANCVEIDIKRGVEPKLD